MPLKTGHIEITDCLQETGFGTPMDAQCDTRFGTLLSTCRIQVFMSKIQLMVKLDVLRPGDWIEMNYGYNRRCFYILKNDPLTETVCIGSPKWCVSSAIKMTYSELRQDDLELLRAYGMARQFENNPVYLGRTKVRWWRKFCIGFRDLIAVYPPPRGLPSWII